MGEQPIFTTKAHVFHIDPQTKKNWIPSSNGSVNVSFYYDSNRTTYRIISVDGSKAIINSTLVPNMTFTKTSQKFGQWSDGRANTVYGLGFSTEVDLNKFAEKFGEVRDLTKHQLAPNSTVPPPKQNGDVVDSTTGVVSSSAAIQNSEYMTPVLDRRPGSSTGNPMPGNTMPGNTMPDSASEQLKYENNRLKLALAQSSQNAKKWEVELQTLKNNNARLTTALQESTINVTEWKKQLASYKEENANLKKMVIEFEQNQPNHQETVTNMQKEMNGMMEKLTIAENDKRSAQQELESARSKFGLVAQLEDSNRKQEQQMMEITREKNELEAKLNAVIDELDKTRSSQTTDKSEMVRVHDIISRNVSELMNAQSQLAKLLNS